MKEVILLLGLLFVAGCTSEVPVEKPISCIDYCPTIPHVQCVGEWNISGNYPNCQCDYVCETSEEIQETPKVETPKPEESQEQVQDEPEKNISTDFPISNQSIDEMLDNGIMKLRVEYLNSHDGTFETTEYKWKFSDLKGVHPGDIVFDQAPSTDVTFDSKPITSLRGAGFLVFESGSDSDVKGILVVLDKETELDKKSTFDIEFFYSKEHRNMESCTITSHDLSKDNKGNWVSKYFLECLEATK